MGSVGTVQSTYTYNSLEGSKQKSFVGMFKNILKENNIPVYKSEVTNSGKISGVGHEKVLQEGVDVQREYGKLYKDPKKSDKYEYITIKTNGHMSKEDAQKIADKIIASDEYKKLMAGKMIKERKIFVK